MFLFISWTFLCTCFFSVTQGIKRKSFLQQKHQVVILYRHENIINLNAVEGEPGIGTGVVEGPWIL